MRKYLVVVLVAALFSLQPGDASAHSADPTPGRITAHDIASQHEAHGHHQFAGGQGDRGHRWSDYRREARQLRAYLAAMARARAQQRFQACSTDGWCSVSLAAYLYGAPSGLMHAIADCESGHNPNARNSSSTASGLFQWIASSWRTASAAIGHAGASVFNGFLNAAAAAHRIVTSGTGDWNASRGCWG